MSTLMARLEREIPCFRSQSINNLVCALRDDVQKEFLEAVGEILDGCDYRGTGNDALDCELRQIYLRRKLIGRYGKKYITVDDVLDSLVPFPQRLNIYKVIGGLTFNEKEYIKACIADYLETGKPTPPSTDLLADMFFVAIKPLKPIHYDNY